MSLCYSHLTGTTTPQHFLRIIKTIWSLLLSWFGRCSRIVAAVTWRLSCGQRLVSAPATQQPWAALCRVSRTVRRRQRCRQQGQPLTCEEPPATDRRGPDVERCSLEGPVPCAAECWLLLPAPKNRARPAARDSCACGRPACTVAVWPVWRCDRCKWAVVTFRRPAAAGYRCSLTTMERLRCYQGAYLGCFASVPKLNLISWCR